MVEQATFGQGMFADSMLEVSWAQRSRRSWTTLTSFGLQAVVIGSLLLIPLLRTVVFPAGHTLPTPVSWGAPPPLAPPAQRRVTTVVQSNLQNDLLITPPVIPPQVAMIEETVAPPQVNFGEGGVEGGLGRGSREGVFGGLENFTTRAVLPPPPPAGPTRPVFRTSSMLQGSLIHSVQPVYPALARTARIQGSVIVSALIAKDGTMENVRAVSGHPMLVTAAVNAVSQWRYKPYILNNEPIEVETRITVNFILSGN